MNLVEYPDAEMMCMDIADRLASELKSALLTHEQVSFAVPGGTTPGPVFDTLSGVSLDWERVRVLPTDERWVPTGHPRSNARLIRERLLVSACAAAAFVPLHRDSGTPEDALEEIAEEVAPLLPLHVLLLGMGADMHTASLFPGAPGLAEALSGAGGPVAILRPEGQPEARVTLTAPVLNGAISKHIVITGDDKRAALDEAVKARAEDAPVHAVLTGTTVHWAP